MKIIENISILGDSIARGVIFDEVLGKYKFLKESAANLFVKSNNITLKNHSKFGYTTQKVLQKLPDILSADNSADIVLLELGGNDCDYNWQEVCSEPLKPHKPNVAFADFKNNLCEIIEKIISSGKKPVAMTLPPIDAERYFNWITKGCSAKIASLLKFLGDKNLIYRHQELYATAFEKIAIKYNLYVVNVREAMLTIPKYSDYLCLDGIHLNTRGQELMKQVCDKAYKEYVAAL
jgi:lysophospholipase L1-like esterase